MNRKLTQQDRFEVLERSFEIFAAVDAREEGVEFFFEPAHARLEHVVTSSETGLREKVPQAVQRRELFIGAHVVFFADLRWRGVDDQGEVAEDLALFLLIFWNIVGQRHRV